MSYYEFCEEIKSIVQSIVGSDYKTSVMKINKLNGVTLQGLIIRKDYETIAPTIYLEEYYTQYQKGRDIESLAIDIIYCYFHGKPSRHSNLAIPFLVDFNTVKDRIFFRLINYDKNRELLETIPYVRWHDLAAIFDVLVKKDTNKIGSFHVINEIMEKWEVDTNEIYNLAMKNTRRLFGSSVRLVDDIIRELIRKEFAQVKDKNIFDNMMETFMPGKNDSGKFHKMYIASNSLGINGAAWLLYEDEIRSLSNKLNASLYIIPSSIHEIIIISAYKWIPKDRLLGMVKEVNNTQVPLQEVLSNNVYFFDRETDKIYPLAS